MKLLGKYPLKCPMCGETQYAEPSLLMKLGTNSGHACCVNCNEFLHLQISESGEYMTAETWEDYLERIRLTPDDVKYFENLMKETV
ncbi:MAG: hypothetical protein QM500_15555 [Methylococcales bacterium]